MALWDNITEQQFALVMGGYEYEATENMAVSERLRHLQLYQDMKKEEAEEMQKSMAKIRRK